MYGTNKNIGLRRSANLLHGAAWSLRRALHLSPTQQLFRELKQRNVPLRRMDALEMFGGDGGRHTVDYQSLVRTLEVWEADGGYGPSLRKNLPGARIKITDSFTELRKTANSYDLIVIDCAAGLYGPAPHYCEHFEIFSPSLFRIARGSAVIVVNVFPDLRPYVKQSTRWREYLSRRSAFYKTSQPELVPIDAMLEVYGCIANAAEFDIVWHFTLRRTWRSKLYYLAMSVARRGRNDAEETSEQPRLEPLLAYR